MNNTLFGGFERFINPHYENPAWILDNQPHDLGKYHLPLNFGSVAVFKTSDNRLRVAVDLPEHQELLEAILDQQLVVGNQIRHQPYPNALHLRLNWDQKKVGLTLNGIQMN